MNIYEKLAYMVDFIHMLVMIYWASGFFVSADRHPDFREYHSIFCAVMLTIQVILSLRCPLVLVSGYLRELANPGFTKNLYYRPFLVALLQDRFGVSVPAILITIITFIGTGTMLVTFLSAG